MERRSPGRLTAKIPKRPGSAKHLDKRPDPREGALAEVGFGIRLSTMSMEQLKREVTALSHRAQAGWIGFTLQFAPSRVLSGKISH